MGVGSQGHGQAGAAWWGPPCDDLPALSLGKEGKALRVQRPGRAGADYWPGLTPRLPCSLVLKTWDSRPQPLQGLDGLCKEIGQAASLSTALLVRPPPALSRLLQLAGPAGVSGQVWEQARRLLQRPVDHGGGCVEAAGDEMPAPPCAGGGCPAGLCPGRATPSGRKVPDAMCTG